MIKCSLSPGDHSLKMFNCANFLNYNMSQGLLEGDGVQTWKGMVDIKVLYFS